MLRYLRQRKELGEAELYLERLTPAAMTRVLARIGHDVGRDPASTRTPTRSTARDAAGDAMPARGAAAEPGGEASFEGFRREVLACTRCRLAEGRRTVVFGEGDRHADLMVVGEAPGGEEDRTGRPFVGPAGQLLDRMLRAIGFARSEVFICNVLKCRPPGNRDPLPDEVASCRPYLQRQVEMIEPKAICAFGRFAAQTLLSTNDSLRRMRGSTHEYLGVPVVVTYHPAALLRNAEWKRSAWEDLQLLRRVYDRAGGRPPGGIDG